MTDLGLIPEVVVVRLGKMSAVLVLNALTFAEDHQLGYIHYNIILERSSELVAGWLAVFTTLVAWWGNMLPAMAPFVWVATYIYRRTLWTEKGRE